MGKFFLFIIFMMVAISIAGCDGDNGISGPAGQKGCDIDQKWDDDLNMCVHNDDFVYPKDGTNGYDELKRVAAEICKEKFGNDYIVELKVAETTQKQIILHCTNTPTPTT